MALPRSKVDCGELVGVQDPDCFGEDLIYFNCFDFYRPRVIIQIKRQILGQARRLERGQQMTVQILAAETIER